MKFTALRARLMLGGALAGIAAVAALTAGTASAGQAAVMSACGTVTYQAPAGSANLASLPASIRAGFGGYPYPVAASVYKSFKAVKNAVKIGYSDSYAANGWREDALDQLKKDAANHKRLVSRVVATNSNLNNTLQIQQITSMIEQHVGAIIAIPNSPTAFNPVIKKAYDAGIPFITEDAHVTSPYAINVDNNTFLQGEKIGAALAKLIHGKGNVLIVDGITGAPANTTEHEGFLAAFKACPGIKVVGSVAGDWSETSTKSAVLQFLATHAGGIDAVVDGGGETVGVIQAFQQTGRKLVPIGDANPDQGSLVALKKYLPNQYVASTDPPRQTASGALETALRVLGGQGLKLNTIVADPPAVTGPAVLRRWTNPAWAQTSVATAPPPPGTLWLASTQLNAFFARPKSIG